MTTLKAATEYDSQEARDLLEAELSRPEYGRTVEEFIGQILKSIERWLTSMFSGGAASVPTVAYWLLPLTIVLLIAAMLLVARWVQVKRRSTSSSFASQARYAGYDEVLSGAQQAFDAGDFDAALRGYFEALSRHAALVEPSDTVRTLSGDIVSSRLRGLTAIEIARDVAQRHRTLQGPAMAAADAFNDVHYGERQATAEAVAVVRDAVALADDANSAGLVTA